MRISPHSLATRVALTTTLSVIAASACVAIISALIADHMARLREDVALRDAAATLALELDTKDADPRVVSEDEKSELAHAAIRIAVFDGRTLIAGDRGLERVEAGTCRDAGELRTCGVAARRWLAVAARNQYVVHEQQRVVLLASALAVLLTSLLGALGARRISRLVTRPLERLRNAVEQPTESDSAAVALGPPSGLVEVDALRNSLAAAFARLGTALNQSQRFASDAAHQLRTPLATLIGELELVAEQLEPEVQKDLARAFRLTRQLSTLVDRLLILAQLEHLSDNERVEVRELVEEAIDGLADPLRMRVEIECTEPDDSAAVDGDRTLLIACFVNALENALKFSKDEVRVRIETADSRVRVSVIDRGEGIPPDERERVFAAFYRTRASRTTSVPGHGIGLAVIAHILALHGGTASFAERKHGAQLDLELPLSRS